MRLGSAFQKNFEKKFAALGVSRGSQHVLDRLSLRSETLPHSGCVIVCRRDSMRLDRRLGAPALRDVDFDFYFDLQLT